MAYCTNCKNKWKIRDVWRLSFSKKGKVCPHCSVRQYVSFKGREPLFGLGYFLMPIAIVIIIFFPFCMKLSDKEEDLL
ncbi:hypothetical protein BM86_17015 [Bacillus thuringiensis]|uniref:CXXC-20-CXXC protein n=1 Tax=Bacillus thuringiensis TaxID=1428 RepID=A0A9W3X4X7_BACTU|nr:hypothetical protein BT246_72440 [Bacillus thuringiensis]MBH0337127.1 hypothetical protein [Bacillus thuringiensis]